MMTNEIRTSIKNVYGMLWEVLAPYEKQSTINTVIKEFNGEHERNKFLPEHKQY